MARFCGIIGFSENKETEGSVWTEVITERSYFGIIIRTNKKVQSGDTIIDGINIVNKISIIADPYSSQNLHAIKYVIYSGAKWKVTDIEVQHPRLILTTGGLYNG